MSRFIILIILLSNTCLHAQDTANKKGPVSWNGYIDLYYSYDFLKPGNHKKPAFLYNYNRHNEVSLNLALLKFRLNDETVRGNIGFMAGTYPQYNLASEPELLRFIYEANVGIKLSKKKALWLDAGILPSHIGLETAIGKECHTLTRSMAADNSPYYQAGIRLSYTSPDKKWEAAGLVLNGWQRMARPDGNNTPSFGTQIKYTPKENLSFNSSAYIGNDQPDSLRQWRYFHDFFATWKISKALEASIVFDMGFQQESKGASVLNKWFTTTLVTRYSPGSWSVSARLENFIDKSAVILPVVNGFTHHLKGYSLNIDRKFKNVMMRIEGRIIDNRYPVFLQGNTFIKSHSAITTAIAVDF